VELDVRRCASGEPVVIHDASARRTAGMPLEIARASLRELRGLDAGAWRGPDFRGERIPTLDAVLRELPRAVVNVELKSDGAFTDTRLARAAAQVIRERGAGRRVVVSSFDPLLLAAFKAAAPEIPIGVLFDAEGRWRLRELVARTLAPAAVHPEWILASAREVERWRAASLAVNVWTVDSPDDVARACELSVTSIITNVPEETRSAVRRVTGR
jgi:glycerophosphoryl diester phosphodiesterase